MSGVALSCPLALGARKELMPRGTGQCNVENGVEGALSSCARCSHRREASYGLTQSAKLRYQASMHVTRDCARGICMSANEGTYRAW